MKLLAYILLMPLLLFAQNLEVENIEDGRIRIKINKSNTYFHISSLQDTSETVAQDSTFLQRPNYLELPIGGSKANGATKYYCTIANLPSGNYIVITDDFQKIKKIKNHIRKK